MIRVVRRYPFAPLARLMGLSEHQASIYLHLGGSTEQKYRRDGMSEKVADRLAVAAHLHPFEVWPEMVDHAAEDASVDCASTTCSERFIPTRKGHRYCSHRCRNREAMRRRYHSDPATAAKARANSARYYAEAGPYVRAQALRRYRENREQRLEQMRARHAAKKAAA